MNERPAVKVICPACRKKGDWFADKYGPFCSERCKLIDLGKWFNSEHAISRPLSDPDLPEPPDENISPLEDWQKS
jgi:endogenous inhibitor of DNA gyrase (YacG/DUF329 family)